MSLKAQIALDADAIFNPDEFADRVTFTPAAQGEIPRTIVVIIELGGDLAHERYRNSMRATGFMQVRLSDFPDAKPDGSVEYQDKTWKIKEQVDQDPISRVVEIEADIRPRY